jgi:hypothetical protein
MVNKDINDIVSYLRYRMRLMGYLPQIGGWAC